ncbi:MAG: alpha/beta hydrolase [Gammaproteobacteria bacterium]
MSNLFFIDQKNNQKLAYKYYSRDLNKPGITFLGGFRSDMTGSKTTFLEQFCEQEDLSYLCFDYAGHGLSSGLFEEGSIGLWKDNAAVLIRELTGNRPQILVGSSMGGWIMLLLALEMPEKIAGLVGIAAAPDFPKELIEPQMTHLQEDLLRSQGYFDVPSNYGEPYKITAHFMREALEHCLLNRGKLNIKTPVRLLHGMQDKDVPYEYSLKIADQVISQDVETILVKNGDHSLSRPNNLDLLGACIQGLLNQKTYS